MLEDIVVNLHSIKEFRNKVEYREVNVASCDEYNLWSQGDGRNIQKIIELLVVNNCDINRGLRVLREGTLVFEVVPLDSWVNPPDRRPEHLKKGASSDG